MCPPWFPGIWTLSARPVQSPTIPPPLRASYTTDRLTNFPGVTTFNTEPLHACLWPGLAGSLWDSPAPVPPFIAGPTHTALEASVPQLTFFA